MIRSRERYGYAKLVAFSLVTASEVLDKEPSSVSSTLASKKIQWLAAMKKEMNLLGLNNTWTLVRRLGSSRLISYKWIFKHKGGILGIDQNIFMERLVAISSN